MANPVIEGLCQKPRGFHRPKKIQSPSGHPFILEMMMKDTYYMTLTHSLTFFYWIPRQIRYFFLFCRFFCDGEVAHPRRSRKITQLPKKAKHENTIHLHDYGFQMFRVLYVVVGIPDGMDYFQVFGHFVWCPLEENTICIYIYTIYTVCFIPFVLDTRPNGVQSSSIYHF